MDIIGEVFPARVVGILISFGLIALGYHGVTHRKEVKNPAYLSAYFFISVVQIITGITGLVAAILFKLGYGPQGP